MVFGKISYRMPGRRREGIEGVSKILNDQQLFRWVFA